MTVISYLGPEGTFSEKVALWFNETFCGDNYDDTNTDESQLKPCKTELDILNSLIKKTAQYAVLAIENNVEGVVNKVIDILIANNQIEVIMSKVLEISFDAVSKKASDNKENYKYALGHPHALAQCKNYLENNNLSPFPTSSNISAVDILNDQQIALIPHNTAIDFFDKHNLKLCDSKVEDYQNTKTRFFIVSTKETAHLAKVQSNISENNRQIVHFIPSHIGPGALLEVLQIFKEHNLNMTELITRPIKAVDNQYGFVAVLQSKIDDENFKKATYQMKQNNMHLRIIGGYRA